MKTRILACIAVVALLAGAALLITPHAMFVHAQQTGIATVVGGVTPSNQFAQTVSTGLAGAVTNPSSNFVIQVAGGPIYFGGGIQDIAQAQMTLLASNTYLVVWNGVTQILYAKQAVTGPGSSGTVPPGVPTSLLYPVTNVEIPLATVVCNATACGNGGNGSITDNRPLSAFPAGQYVGGHLNQSAAGTTSAGAGTMPSTAGICTASAATTCVVTFSTAFQATPSCVVTDQTTTANGALKALPTTTTLTITTASSSDTFSYLCIGNPN
jgi:hypothetical protein